MATRIHLLGAPCIERNGTPVPPPRGGKSWALLAYLLLMARPVPRPRLAELLFEEADDPAAALRWTLSQVRRALGSGAQVGGDPVRIELTAETVVDVDVVASGSWQQALDLPGFGGELLEGVSPRVGPAFELWLSTERRRLAGATQAVLHGAAHSRLAAGDTAAAVGLAARLVSGDPLDESAQELLVRALVAAGDRTAAEEQVARCSALFQRELGVAPSPALFDALSSRPAPSAAGTRGAVLAQIEAGDATAHAGAYDPAVQVLRSAAGAARQLGEDDLVGRALAALGAALVEGVRGADEEGMSVLHEAVLLARRAGDRPTAARAAQEIEHVETLRARYAGMEVWAARARELAVGEPRLLAWTEVYAGLGRSRPGRLRGSGDGAGERGAAGSVGRGVAGPGLRARGTGPTAVAARRGPGCPQLPGSGMRHRPPGRLHLLPGLPRVPAGRGGPARGGPGPSRWGIRAFLRPGLSGRRPLLGELLLTRPWSARRRRWR